VTVTRLWTPSLLQDKAPIREGINFPQTVYNTLAGIFKGGYDIINSTHGEQRSPLWCPPKAVSSN